MRQSNLVWKLLGLAFTITSCATASGGGWALARSAGDSELNWGTCPEFFPAGCQIAFLHGNPDEPNADIFFRVPGEYTLPRHRHTSAERMVLVAGELHVTWDGQRTVELTAGTYAYGPPQLAHSGRCVSEDPCVLFIAFEAPVDASVVATEIP